MTELLTESFCERCGTRYTFQTAAPKGGRVRSIKTLSKGLRNFVASDDISLSDAFADARSDDDREASSRQLEAFHKTFNFCLNCRQYTCGNCWNEGDNRCLTCAPDLSREILPAAFPAPVGQEVEPPTSVSAEPALEVSSWPMEDLDRVEPTVIPISHVPAVPEPEVAAPEPDVAAPEPVVTETPVAAEPAAELRPEPQIAVGPEPAVEQPAQVPEAPAAAAAAAAAAAVERASEPSARPPAAPSPTDERAAAAAASTGALLRRFRPGESLDAVLAEYEASQAPAAEPVQAAGPVQAAPPAPPTQPAGAPAAAASAPQPPAATPPRDVVGTPTWQITAPDTEGPAAPAATPGVPASGTTPAWPPLPPGTEPSWPVAPQWPPRPTPAGTPGQDAMWAASSQDVLAGAQAPSATRPCVSCGLSLSSTARFCRRCGSQQG